MAFLIYSSAYENYRFVSAQYVGHDVGFQLKLVKAVSVVNTTKAWVQMINVIESYVRISVRFWKLT